MVDSVSEIGLSSLERYVDKQLKVESHHENNFELRANTTGDYRVGTSRHN